MFHDSCNVKIPQPPECRRVVDGPPLYLIIFIAVTILIVVSLVAAGLYRNIQAAGQEARVEFRQFAEGAFNTGMGAREALTTVGIPQYRYAGAGHEGFVEVEEADAQAP